MTYYRAVRLGEKAENLKMVKTRLWRHVENPGKFLPREPDGGEIDGLGPPGSGAAHPLRGVAADGGSYADDDVAGAIKRWFWRVGRTNYRRDHHRDPCEHLLDLDAD